MSKQRQTALQSKGMSKKQATNVARKIERSSHKGKR